MSSSEEFKACADHKFAHVDKSILIPISGMIFPNPALMLFVIFIFIYLIFLIIRIMVKNRKNIDLLVKYMFLYSL